MNSLSWTSDGETLISGGDDTTFVFPPIVYSLRAPQLECHTLFILPLLMAVPYNQPAFDSGECQKTRATRRMSIPLSAIIEFRRDIGTIFSPQRCCRSRPGCAYSPLFGHTFVSPWSHKLTNRHGFTVLPQLEMAWLGSSTSAQR